MSADQPFCLFFFCFLFCLLHSLFANVLLPNAVDYFGINSMRLFSLVFINWFFSLYVQLIEIVENKLNARIKVMDEKEKRKVDNTNVFTPVNCT